MKHIFFIIYLFFALLSNAQHKIEFVSEDITFEIKNDTFFVNGTYFFKNIKDSCSKITISYPFPENKYMGCVKNFELYTDTNKTKYSLIDISNKRTLFTSEHCDSNMFFFNIKYQQQLLKDTAKYILTTTKNWHKPLHTADYKLIVPSDMKIIFFSYYPDTELLIEDKKIYIWHKINFYPDKDFLIKYDR